MSNSLVKFCIFVNKSKTAVPGRENAVDDKSVIVISSYCGVEPQYKA